MSDHVQVSYKIKFTFFVVVVSMTSTFSKDIKFSTRELFLD